MIQTWPNCFCWLCLAGQQRYTSFCGHMACQDVMIKCLSTAANAFENSKDVYNTYMYSIIVHFFSNSLFVYTRFENNLYLSLVMCICTCIYTCMYLTMHVCMHVCVHVCVHVCMYVCMYVYILLPTNTKGIENWVK